MDVLSKEPSVVPVTSPDPFKCATRWLADSGHDPAQVLWVMPRLEAVNVFRQHWAEYHHAQPSLGPWVQTADRLSQPATAGAWMGLQANLVGVLRGLSFLSGGLSASQLWGLAQEYLQLAMQLVLVQKHNKKAIADYAQSNAFAAEEIQVVANLAQVYEAELFDLITKPDPARPAPAAVFWFDDGETVPAAWLGLFYPDVPVHVLHLPSVEGPQLWLELARTRFAGPSAGVGLLIARDEATQAQQAAAQVLQWLEDDPGEEVAVAVLDRLSARRVVALLAEQGVLVDDRTGWRLSTSSVAGWFDGLVNEYAAARQLHAIVHPFTGEPQSLSIPWVCGKANATHTLAHWASAWSALLGQQGLLAVLESDEAGRQLLGLLRLMQRGSSDTVFDASAFLAAWRHWAENQRFRPLDIESPVRMLPLLSTRMRPFKRVLVLGCAQSHFQESPPGLLPPSVAQELGFPGPRLARVQKLSALHALLDNAQSVALAHCQMVAGKPELLLPELHWLDIVLHQVDEKPAGALGDAQPGWSVRWLKKFDDEEIPIDHHPENPLALRAQPNGQSIPEQLKVTALDDWVACRLRFGLKHALPWPVQTGLGEFSFEQLRGIFVHKVLEKAALHMSKAGHVQHDLQAWKQCLDDQAQSVWQGMQPLDRAKVYPFLKYFGQLVPRVAGKLMERQIEGWSFRQVEQQVSGELPLRKFDRAVRLVGRVDRVDERAGQLGIVDIKFTKPSELKKRAAAPLAQPQLPVYEMLLKAQPARLEFLGLHKDEVDWVPFPDLPDDLREQGFQSWGEAMLHQLIIEMQSFFDGDTLWQANPGEDVCQWCTVKGVCRPDLNGAALALEDQDE